MLGAEKRSVPVDLVKAQLFGAKLREAEARRQHGQNRLPRTARVKWLGNYHGRGLYSVLWRLAGRGFLGLALVSGAVEYVSFDSFSVPSLDRIHQVSAAVVFTGQFERVDVGLRLADAGAVPRLYISGVNGKAGMDPAHFVEQFSIRNPDIPDLRRLVACCAEWGQRADNTFQNAQDSKCWLHRRALIGPLLLITSRQTMARAMAALSGALPDRVIVPYPVEDGLPTGGRTRMRAYLKYLVTIVAARLPLSVASQRVYGPFVHGCPDTL
jgi:uncharacterized SAM-binding protein YcdF (DUF218 family)